MKIFLSYPRESCKEAEYIRAELLQRGFSVFMDTESLNMSHDWRVYIEHQIEKHEVFVILFRKSGYERPGYFATELRRIIRRIERVGVAIVVVFPPSICDDLPPGLKRFHCVKANKGKEAWSDDLLMEVHRLRQKKKWRRASISGAMGVAVLVLALGVIRLKQPPINTPPQTPSINSIKIGSVITTIGEHRHIGADQAIGIEVAQKYLQQEYDSKIGGVNIVIESPNEIDYSPEKAVKAMKFLTKFESGNVAVIGPTLSSQAVEILEEADSWKTPIVAPSNTKSELPQQSDYYFRVSSPVEEKVKYSIDFAISSLGNISDEKIVILYANDDHYAISEKNAFVDYVMNKRIRKVHSIYPYERNESLEGLFERLNKLLQYDTPEIIIISGLTSDGGQIIKYLRDSDYTGLIIGGNGLNSRQLFEKCLQACNGVIISQAYVHSSNIKINETFKRLYKEIIQEITDNSFPDEPPQFTAQIFAAAQVLLQSIENISKSSEFESMNLLNLRQKLREELPGKSFQTVLGNIKFDEYGEIIQQNKDFSASIVEGVDENGKNGRFKLID